MEMRVDIYLGLTDTKENVYCFSCGVQKMLNKKIKVDFFVQDRTFNDQDMRSSPKCKVCGKHLELHPII